MSKYKKAIQAFTEGLPGGNAVATAIEACKIADSLVHCEECVNWTKWPTSDHYGDCEQLYRCTKDMNWCCYGIKRGDE